MRDLGFKLCLALLLGQDHVALLIFGLWRGSSTLRFDPLDGLILELCLENLPLVSGVLELQIYTNQEQAARGSVNW